jgi:hypothetical protein
LVTNTLCREHDSPLHNISLFEHFADGGNDSKNITKIDKPI